MDFDRTRDSNLITEYLGKKQNITKVTTNKQAMLRIHNFLMRIRAAREFILALLQTNISPYCLAVEDRLYIYAAANYPWHQLNA
jgi:hypothetical protein